MTVIIIWILCIPIISLVISTNCDVVLKGIILIPLLVFFASAAEIEKYKQAKRWKKCKDEYKKTLLKRHNSIAKQSTKYIAFIFKAILYIYEIIGFYQWFSKMYSYVIYAVLHLIIVTVLLIFNIYVDTFEGEWYRRLNINFIKDNFIQRKLITMILLIVIVLLNSFIVYLF